MSVRTVAEQLVRWTEQTRIGVRQIRRYRGFPVDDAAVFADGTVAFDVDPPQGWGWEIIGAMWEMNAVGAVIPTMNVRRNSDDSVILPVRLPVLGAGLYGTYYFMQAASYPMYTIPGLAQGTVFPLPLNGELKDEHIELYLDGGGAGDTHRLFIYYEEFKL